MSRGLPWVEWLIRAEQFAPAGIFPIVMSR
jgi:hypothetical protein